MPESIRDTILTRSRSAMNGVLPTRISHRKSAVNPLCGDQVEIALDVLYGRVVDCGYCAYSCAICAASACMWSEYVKGKFICDLELVFRRFSAALHEKPEAYWHESLGAFSSFEYLRAHRSRRDCALLPVHAILESIGFGGVLGS